MTGDSHPNEREGRGRQPDGRQRLILVALIALAVATRMGFAQLERVIKWDESDYLMLGRNLLSGRGFTTAGYPEVHYPPLLPVVLGIAQKITSEPEAASELAYIIFGALLILPVHTLARRMYGHGVAQLASILLIFFPALGVSVLYWGTMSEPLYLFLVYCGLYALWRASEADGWAYHGLAGLMFGLAYLTRPDAMLYFGILLAAAILWYGLKRRLGEPRVWAGIAAYAGAFALCALPYVIYLYQHTGQLTFSGKVGVTFDLGAAVIEQDPAAYDVATASLDDSGQHIIWFSPERFQSAGMSGHVLSDPLGFARRALANLQLWEGQFFRKSVYPYFALGFVILGLCKQAWTRARTRQELFLLAALLPPFGFLALHIELRFFAPLFPILLLWTAKGLVELGAWLHDTVLNWREWRPMSAGWRGALWVLPGCAMAAYLLLMLPVAAREGQRGTDLASKQVGLWLRENAGPKAKVLSRDVAVAVYAERDWAPSPHAGYDAFVDYARFHLVDYIVIGQREVTVLRPDLSFLLAPSAAPPELEWVHAAQTSQGETLVYRLRR